MTPPWRPAEPLQLPAPVCEQRSLLFELQDGTLVQGVTVWGDRARHCLSLPGGEQRIVERDSRAALTPLAGPLRTFQPDPWPVALEPRLGSGAETARDLALAERQQVYLLADGALVPADARGQLPPAQSLLPGRLSRQQVDTGPYLVTVSTDAPLLERALSEGWGSVLLSRSERRPLMLHLRRFLKVKDSRNGESLHFRFFDPNTLRVYLATLDEDEAGCVFGTLSHEASDELACPVCDTTVEALQPCGWCGAAFATPPDAPTLIGGVILPDAPGHSVFARPARSLRRKSRGSGRLSIREEQLEALGDLHARQQGISSAREDALVERVQERFPGQCARLGPEATRQHVLAGVARAAAYRVWADEDVERFLDVLFMIDHAFEEHPWAWTWIEALQSAAPASERVTTLRSLAKEHLERRRALTGQ